MASTRLVLSVSCFFFSALDTARRRRGNAYFASPVDRNHSIYGVTSRGRRSFRFGAWSNSSGLVRLEMMRFISLGSLAVFDNKHGRFYRLLIARLPSCGLPRHPQRGRKSLRSRNPVSRDGFKSSRSWRNIFALVYAFLDSYFPHVIFISAHGRFREQGVAAIKRGPPAGNFSRKKFRTRCAHTSCRECE